MSRADDDQSQLLNELDALRQRVADLEAQQAEWQCTAAALQESEENLRTLINATPDFICFKDGQGRWLEVNEFAVRLFELQDVDWRGKTDADLAQISSFFRPALLYCVQTDEQAWQSSGNRIEEVIPNPHGQPWILDVIKIPTFEANGRRKGLVIVGRDISARKRVEAALYRRDAILSAVSYSTELFLRAGVWDQNIQKFLAELGQAAAVSRVYIFKKSDVDIRASLINQCYEWTAPGISPQLSNPGLQKFDLDLNGFGRWIEAFKVGQAIYGHVREFPAGEQPLLLAQEIYSLVVVPIFVGQGWWGFIGLDECQTERVWSVGEIEALKAAAGILGAAIQRQQIEQALRESESRYRAIVEDQTELVCRFKADTTLTFVNEAYCRYFDQPAEALVGQSFLALIPEDEQSKVTARINFLSPDNPDTVYHHRVIAASGELRWQEGRDRALFDETGQISEIQSVGRDITERREMEQALHKRNQELELLNRSSQAFIASLELDQVLTAVLEEVRQALEVVACSIWLLDPASGELVCRQAAGPQRALVQGWRLKAGQGLVGWVVQHNQSLNVPDIRADQRHFQGVDQQTGLVLHSILTVPLPGKAGPIGGLQLVDEAVGRFNETDLRLCELLAAAAAGAIEHARLFESLKASQEYAQNIIDSSMDMIITVDMQRRVVEFNRTAEQTFGHQRTEVVGQSVDLLYADPVKAQTIHRLAIEQGRAIQEVLNKRRNGDLFPALLAASPLRRANGEIAGVMGISREITVQKLAEAELERRNRELNLLNRVIVASAEGLATAAILDIACRELAQLFDLPQAAALLLNDAGTAATVVVEYRADERPIILNEVLPVGDDDPSANFLANMRTPLVIEDGPNDPHLTLVQPLLRRSGTVSMMILPLLVEGEAVGGLSLSTTTKHSFTASDIELAWRVTRQVAGALSRARLIESQRRLSAAVEQTDDSVLICDAAGMIVYANPAYERTSGYRRTEVIGRQARHLKREQNGNVDESLWDEICQTLAAGRAWRGRLINRKKSGEPYTDEVTITPVRDEAGQVAAYVSVQRDVTREQKLESQLRQAQKMEAVGQLAGGIAHDFNNILTAIMGYGGLAQTLLPTDHPAYQDLKGIQKSAQRAAALVRRLLTFARATHAGQAHILDLNSLILNQAPLLRRFLSATIELVILPAPEPAPVKIDLHQLEQVLLNLAVNARDAMPEGGKLTLTTAVVTLAETAAGEVGLEPGRYIRLAVSDTGMGIPAENKDRIFEPFFTTKEAGQGTGLGLAICLEIIKQHQGYIQVETAAGQGSTFNIYLPRASGTAVSVLPSFERQMTPQGRGETILLVEDEPAIQALAFRTLQEQGYTVLTATNGEEALRLIESQPAPKVDLLLTDVVMPLLSGRELARRLRASQPGAKVLFISGYVIDEDFRDELQGTGVSFLPKPFTPAELAGRVHHILDD